MNRFFFAFKLKNKNMNTDLINYYKNRANEYERIYSKPERQNDLKEVALSLQNIFENKTVLEIACGTGYWTEKIAGTATSVFATDINKEVIDIARKKEIKNKEVSFEVADMYTLDPAKKYDSLFGGFIFSHILKQDVENFFDTINKFVKPNGKIVLMDNNFVEGSNLPVTYTDDNQNTFQTRLLDDGTSHLVLKNFPTENYLRKKLKGKASEICFINMEYFWILYYKTC